MGVINQYYKIKTHQARTEMIYNTAAQKARKNFQKRFGSDMTPSRLEDEKQGGFMSYPAREYEKDRDAIFSDLKNKMRKKGVY